MDIVWVMGGVFWGKLPSASHLYVNPYCDWCDGNTSGDYCKYCDGSDYCNYSVTVAS